MSEPDYIMIDISLPKEYKQKGEIIEERVDKFITEIMLRGGPKYEG